MPESLRCDASPGSFRYWSVMIPLTASGEPADRCAAVRNVSVAETEFTYSFGFQPSLYAITSDWIVAVGVTSTRNVSAPEAFSFTTCDCGDGDVTSKPSSSTIWFLFFSASLNEFR